jgi:hypothetical protein
MITPYACISQPWELPFRVNSAEGLLMSILGRWTLLELDLLLPFRISLGSITLKPLAFANRIRMSVKLTTPTSRPLILAPGIEPADTEGPTGVMNGVGGDASPILCGSADVADGGTI